MRGSIIGEPTDKYVVDQVKYRQQVYGKGIEGNTIRSIEERNYLNNRTAWIKMGSSVSVDDTALRLPTGLSNLDEYKGINLATKAILFNGLSSLNEQQRSGVELVKNSYFNNSVYGLGGTQFGIQPMPGINSINIDSKNRGSIRTATVDITAFNKFQFELIETLYLRLGFTMLIEWGWDKYIDENGKIKTTGATLMEEGFFVSSNQDDMLSEIREIKKFYQGNYDGFFGRVTNFNWNFNEDGSYSISIKLTSLGDVIESLKINQSPSQELKTSIEAVSHKRFELLENANSSITTNKAITKLGAILYKKLNNEKLWGVDGDQNYYNLFLALENSSYKQITNGNTNNVDLKYCYYIRFGELCKIIQDQIIPDVNNSGEIKHIKFDLDEDLTICSYYPNLISFDPKLCIINTHDDIVLNQYDISNIKQPDYTKSDYLKSFAQKISGNKKEDNIGPDIPADKLVKGDLTYGKIYNIYINYDLIFNTLKNNTDSEGNLSLFKFLSGICKSINSSFANVTNIEPIIKDDKIITFLDQKPIMGLTKRLPDLITGTLTETANIEVYGFNSDTLDGSFLKNISFNTKLSSKLANQISIGATAKGVVAGEDSTGYSNWNRGLIDRFQVSIDDPSTEDETTDTTTLTTNPSPENEKDEKSTIKFVSYTGGDPVLSAIAKDSRVPADTFPYTIETSIPMRGNEGNGELITFEIDSNGNIPTGKITVSKYKSPKGTGELKSLQSNISSYTELGRFGGGTTLGDNRLKFEKEWLIGFSKAYGVELNEAAFERKKKYGSLKEIFSAPKIGLTEEGEDSVKENKEKRKRKLIGLNYSAYLAQMFGGEPTVKNEVQNETRLSTKPIDPLDSVYPFPKDKEQYSDLGKSAYKTYIKKWGLETYGKGKGNAKTPSNQIGLIPIEFEMEMDGISGFKIYNKIDIQQRFLPSNYGEALEFLVKGINHKVDINGWSTNLQTLSTSNLSTTVVKSNKPYKEPQTRDLSNVFVGSTPNADRLRLAIKNVGYVEKGNELSNGGDITSNAADVGIALVNTIKQQVPNVTLTFTGGNDKYHQTLSYTSRHKTGNALDFVFSPYTKEDKDKIVAVLQGFAAGSNPLIRFIDEYDNPTSAATAAHFHVSYGKGTEGKDSLNEAIALAQEGEITTFTV